MALLLFLIFWAVICWIGGATAGMGALAALIIILVLEVLVTDDEQTAGCGCMLIIALVIFGLFLVL